MSSNLTISPGIPLEEALFSDCLLILRASRPHGLDFRDLGDGYIPPGFVSGNALIICRLNDDDGCLLGLTGGEESLFEFVAGGGSNRFRSKTSRIRDVIHGD